MEATLGVNGGTVVGEDVAGNTLELTLPPGALLGDTTVRVTPQTADADEVARFTIEPAGLVLWQAGTMTLTTSATLPEGVGFFWSDLGAATLTAGDADDAHTLVGELTVLGGVGPSVTATLVADGSAGTTQPAVGATTVTAKPVDCRAELDALDVALASGAFDGTPAQMAAEWARVAVLTERCESSQVGRLDTLTCDAYRTAELAAQATAVTDFESFQSIVIRLATTRGDTQITGAVCDTAAYDGLIEAKFEQVIAFTHAAYTADRLVDELDAELERFRTLASYEAVCQVRGLSDTVCDRFAGELYPDVLDELRASAWSICRTRDNPTVLAMLYAESLYDARDETTPDKTGGPGPYLDYGRYTYDTLATDAAYCAGQLDVSVFDDAKTLPEEIPDLGLTLEPGDAPGSQVVEAAVNVPADGSLTLGGSIHGLVCANGSVSADELVARVNGVPVARRGMSGDRFTVDTSPLDLIVADVLKTAELPADTDRFDVQLWREGPGCGRVPSDLKMYTLHVEVGAPLATASIVGGIDWSDYAVRTYSGVDCETDSDISAFSRTTGTDAELPLVFGPLTIPTPVSNTIRMTAAGVALGSSVFTCPNGDRYTLTDGAQLSVTLFVRALSPGAKVTLSGEASLFNGCAMVVSAASAAAVATGPLGSVGELCPAGGTNLPLPETGGLAIRIPLRWNGAMTLPTGPWVTVSFLP